MPQEATPEYLSVKTFVVHVACCFASSHFNKRLIVMTVSTQFVPILKTVHSQEVCVCVCVCACMRVCGDKVYFE